MKTTIAFSIAICVAILLSVTLVMLITWPTFEVANASNPLKQSEMGDYLAGHLGPAVAIISAVLFFVAILLQRQELRDARSVFTNHRDIAQKELTKLEEQITNDKKMSHVAALVDILQIRIDLRLEARKLNANKEPNWKKISQELEDRYTSTEIAASHYLDHIENLNEKSMLTQLLMIGTKVST